MSLEEYGAHFRDTFALLHGGRPGEFYVSEYREGESAQAFLDRTRHEVLEKAREDFSAIPPPGDLEEVHSILLRLLDRAIQAESALSEQVTAYSQDRFQESVEHSTRLQDLVAESGELDKRLIVALEELEVKIPGTLAALGMGDTVADEEENNDANGS